MSDHEDRTEESRIDGERKEYFPPKVIHSERLTGRATTCAAADSATCGSGPIQS